MKRFAVISTFLFASTALAQTDTLRAKLDSLFLRATAPEQKYRHVVGPAVKILRESPVALPYLIEKMAARDARERRTLIDSLLIKMPQAIPSVIAATQSPNKDVARTAAEVLSKLPDERATPNLVKLLAHPDIQARGYAAVALGKCGGIGSREGLLKALKDSIGFVRTQAAVGLGYLHDTSTLPDLIRALRDDYYGVRFSTVVSLVKFKNQSLPYLYQALQSESPMGRQLAAEALGKIQAKAAAPHLSRLLKSPLWSDRLAAIEALAQINSPSAQRLLSSHIEKDVLVKARQKDLLKK